MTMEVQECITQVIVMQVLLTTPLHSMQTSVYQPLKKCDNVLLTKEPS